MFDKKEMLLELFNKWIKELGIEVCLIEANNNDVEKIVNKNYNNSIYLCEILSDEVFNFIDDDIKSNLLDGLTKIDTPKDSIASIAQAFEDYLRLIDKTKNSTLSSTSGIAQLANELRSRNIIHQKINKIAEAISDIRNMSGHSKEKETLQSWKLTKNAAISYIHLATVTMLSIYNFVFKNIQVL